MNITKEQLKGIFSEAVDKLFSGESEAKATSTKAPRHSFRKDQILVTVKELHSADGEITIPVGTKAIYLGQNEELPKEFLDVAWLSQEVNDNGKRWKHTGFRLA